MKKSYVIILTAAISLGLASCGGKKASDAAQDAAAANAGIISKSVLTEEIKQETISLLTDLPASDIPQRIAAGEIEIAVGNLSYMLAPSKAAELTTASQKARALGVYIADYNVLRVLQQPLTTIEGVLAKLTSDLDITFILNTLKATPMPANKEEIRGMLRAQEEAVINALAANDKINVAVELLGGMAVENAYLYANPTLVVKGDITYVETLSNNMLKRFGILGEIVDDLSAYYPELKTLSETLTPLPDKLTSVDAARKANAEIIGIRDQLLK
ncbi:MAG: hypothetical protein LBD28_04925 [Tannerellaceae bacterium]|jgi:hypothetical protein|nr:hypothetical protein [Tannerellaceae bacterium]